MRWPTGARPWPSTTGRRVDAAPTALLGAIHGGVGVPQQAVGGGGVVGDGDAKAGRTAEVLISDSHGRFSACRTRSAISRSRGRRRRRRPLHELVSAEAGHGVTGSDRPADATGDMLEQVVAVGWPKESLTILKWSMSRNITASCEPRRLGLARPWTGGRRAAPGSEGRLASRGAPGGRGPTPVFAPGDVLELREEVLGRPRRRAPG